jgi:dTMP kinase
MSTDVRGKFIVFEGVDGAGKTTQRRLVAERLRADGKEVVETREPGGTPFAEEIRTLALAGRDEPISPTTELLLMFAARGQHMRQVIRPALEAGKWVLCDRFIESSYAYQVRGKGAEEALFYDLVVHVVGATIPDLTLFLDLPDEIANERRLARTEQFDRMDAETAAFHATVRQTLRELSTMPRHRVINGNQPIDAVTADILTALNEWEAPWILEK